MLFFSKKFYLILYFLLYIPFVAKAEALRLWSPPFFIENEVDFSTPKGLEEEVQFWIKIYTQYTTQQGVFHISGDITNILGEIDVSPIYLNKEWGPIRKEKEAEKMIRIEKNKIAKKMNIKNVKKIRLQMGLKDRMQTALFQSGAYLPMMEQVFKKHNLPLALTRIVFVESSFNVKAQSKVGASGLWQIMPIIGKKFKYIKPHSDQRNHPEYATELAAKILKQNFQILKSWPLAVTSYNFGVGSMLKVKRKMKNFSDKDLFNSKELNKFIGFASRNFYATFLAALYVENHANIYFGEPLYISQSYDLKNNTLKESKKMTQLISDFNITHENFIKYNPHIHSKYLKITSQVPAGTLFSIPRELKDLKNADILPE